MNKFCYPANLKRIYIINDIAKFVAGIKMGSKQRIRLFNGKICP